MIVRSRFHHLACLAAAAALSTLPSLTTNSIAAGYPEHDISRHLGPLPPPPPPYRPAPQTRYQAVASAGICKLVHTTEGRKVDAQSFLLYQAPNVRSLPDHPRCHSKRPKSTTRLVTRINKSTAFLSPSAPLSSPCRATTHRQNVWRGVVIPLCGADKRRQPVPAGLLHHHVQRSGMVCTKQTLLPSLCASAHQKALRRVLFCVPVTAGANLRYSRSDYINPIDLCNRLNTYIIPEAAVHGFLTFLFLINGYWLPLILNLPLLAWNVKKYVISKGLPHLPRPLLGLHRQGTDLLLNRIFENTHLLDATEIFRKLNVHKKVRSIWPATDICCDWLADTKCRNRLSNSVST